MRGQKTLFSKASDEWGTPLKLFQGLHEIHNFTVDAAASHQNNLLDRYWTKEDDALTKSWKGERVWLNPPYSRCNEFVEKAVESDAEVVVMLLPARTDTAWFHEFLYDEELGCEQQGVEITFIRGRLKFEECTWEGRKPQKNSAPFPSMIVEIRP